MFCCDLRKDKEKDDFYDIVYLSNILHITEWLVTINLMTQASKVLAENGKLLIYGPFIIDGKSAPSNFQFSKTLQQRNELWGVRELRKVEKIGEVNGLQLLKIIDMPANNTIAVFAKADKKSTL